MLGARVDRVDFAQVWSGREAAQRLHPAPFAPQAFNSGGSIGNALMRLPVGTEL